MKTLIIQTSPHHTASTFLVNALYGLIPKLNNTKIIGIWNENFEEYFDDIIVLKNHNTNIDELIERFNKNYKLYFVCSERRSMNYLIDDKYKDYNKYKNVTIFDYNELNETSTNTIPKIMENIYEKISKMLGIELNVEGGVNRIAMMNTRYEEIKEYPFSYIDDFFEIHGSHRNKKNSMNCCICGPVKNCGPYLNKVLRNAEKIGSVFNDYQILIYYDKSDDNTLEILKHHNQRNPKIMFFENKNRVSPFRTHNIANARNFCLNYVRKNSTYFPFFIMMDFDDVNCKEVNVEPLKRSLFREDWDGLSFNTSPYYYDIWGVSIWPYCFSYNHFNNNYKYHEIIRDYVMNQLKKLKPGQLLPCISSFNGFSIYRTSKFLDTYYDGRVRKDLFTKYQLQIHAKAQKSRGLVYKDYGHVKGMYEDCEHRAFHQQARIKSGARIMISPEILFH